MDLELINLTPHPLTFFTAEGDLRLQLPAGDKVARLATRDAGRSVVAGIDVAEASLGEILGLPAPREGAVYITSSLIAQEASRIGRTDVLAPDTDVGSARRDEQGRIIGVAGLRRFWIEPPHGGST